MTNLNIKSNSRGFTIVELLVVIVVIGILAAITIISYTGITDRAKASQAASNSSAVASVAETYFADCLAYPSTVQLGTGACPTGSVVAASKLPSTIGAIAPIAGAALTTNNFTTNVIYVLKGTTGACIANYDPTFTTGVVLPNYTNIKVTLLGSATVGFVVTATPTNPNTAIVTCS